MDAIAQCRGQVVDLVGELLVSCGFGESPDEYDAGKHHFYRWQRRAAWKLDVVKLSFSRNLPRCIDVGLFLELPCGAERHFLDAASVQGVIGQVRDYCIPGSVSVTVRLHCSRFAAAVCGDLHMALKWFDTYSSASEALEMLRAGRIENAPRGGPVFALFEEHLQRASADRAG